MDALQFLRQFAWFPSTQKTPCNATSSERRRLLLNKAVEINGTCPGPTDLIEFPVESCIVFPKGKRRTTLR